MGLGILRLAGSLGRAGTAFGPRAAATTIPLLQKSAQFLGNPWGRGAVGGTIGAVTNQDGTIGGRVRGALVGAGLGALQFLDLVGVRLKPLVRWLVWV